MALSRDEIEIKVAEVLEEALGVDAEEITPEATLIGDLGAESIDFLDISFQLEKVFEPNCSPDHPFKIEQGELFPEDLLTDESFVDNGRVTDVGMVALREKMPHVDFAEFESDRSVSKVSELFTVKALVEFCERKLAVCAA